MAQSVIQVISGEVDILTSRLSGSLVPAAYDAIVVSYATTTDTYVYKTGGASGTTVRTVTVNWTDATKTVLVSVVAS